MTDKRPHLKLVKSGDAPVTMTRDDLLNRLAQVLREYKAEDVSLSVHISLCSLKEPDGTTPDDDFGDLVPGDQMELWYDENLQQFVPFDPDEDDD
jgi:hypothetical protein